MNFEYNDYEYIVKSIQAQGYVFTNYKDYKNVDKPCIMRHDVDFSIEKAAEFADFESQLIENGLKSVYFVLLSSNFYNLFSKESRQHLENIQKHGHLIGLHFDETQYDIGSDESLIIEKIQEEVSVLSQLLSSDVTCVSMHRPSKNLLDKNLVIPNVVNSYSNTFFKDFKYVSDSRMNWRESPIDAINDNNSNALHVLTHPFWYGWNNITERLKDFVESASMERYNMLNKNIRDLKRDLRVEDVLR